METLTFIYMHGGSNALCKIKTVAAIPEQRVKERSEIRGWQPNHSGTLTSIHQLERNVIPAY